LTIEFVARISTGTERFSGDAEIVEALLYGHFGSKTHRQQDTSAALPKCPFDHIISSII